MIRSPDGGRSTSPKCCLYRSRRISFWCSVNWMSASLPLYSHRLITKSFNLNKYNFLGGVVGGLAVDLVVGWPCLFGNIWCYFFCIIWIFLFWITLWTVRNIFIINPTQNIVQNIFCSYFVTKMRCLPRRHFENVLLISTADFECFLFAVD